jgi:hypothetical protein
MPMDQSKAQKTSEYKTQHLSHPRPPSLCAFTLCRPPPRVSHIFGHPPFYTMPPSEPDPHTTACRSCGVRMACLPAGPDPHTTARRSCGIPMKCSRPKSSTCCLCASLMHTATVAH